MAYQRLTELNSVLGVVKDRPASEVPNNYWTDVLNVKFNKGQATLADGYTQIFETNTEAPTWAISRLESGTPYWYYGSATKISRTEGASHTDVSRTVGGAYTDDGWNGCSLNGVMIFNNNVDQLQVLEGGDSTFKDSVSFPATIKAKVVRSFKNYLVALNLTDTGAEKPYAVRWSDAADPGLEPTSWDITDPTVDAGQTQLSDSVGEIVDGLALRDQFIIYKTDAVYSMRFVGGTFIFNFRKVFDKWGALSDNCIGSFEGKHFVVGRDDIYVHDAVQLTSISEQFIKDYFYDSLNESFIDNIHVVPNYKETEMWINFPSNDSGNTGECDRAIVWNWKENLWSIRELPNIRYSSFGIIDPQNSEQWDDAVGSWDSVSRPWNASTYNPSKNSILMLSTTDSKFYSVGEESTFDGTDFSWRLEKSSINFDDPFEFKYINAVLPKLVGDGAVTVSVGTQDRIGDGINWSSPVSYDPSQDVRAYFRKNGRYVSFKFEGTSANQFQLAGFGLEGTITGEK